MSSVLASARLIVRHDLRLFWREINRDTTSRVRSLLPLVFLFGTAQFAAAFAMTAMKTAPSAGYGTLAWLFISAIMLPMAMQRTISLLYERNDLDLLLASPLPPRALLLGRLGSIAATCFCFSSLFVVPVLNALVFHFGPTFFAAFVVWILLCLVNATAGIGLTLLLVQRLGVRTARTVAQVLAALLGLMPMLACLAPAMLVKHPGPLRNQLVALLDDPFFSGLGRASRGAPVPLALLALVAVLITALVTRQLARVFVVGIQESSVRAVSTKTPAPHRWTAGLWPVLMRKELRLLRRNPVLLSQLLPTTLMLVVVGICLAAIMGIVVLGPLAPYFSGTLALVIAFAAAQGEVGWDLVRLSSTAETKIRRLKVTLSILTALLPAALATIVLAFGGRPGLALFAFAAAVPGTIAAAWVGTVANPPALRQDVYQPPKGRALAYQLIVMALAMLGGASVALASAGSYGFSGFAIGVLLLGSLACLTLIGPDSADSVL